jgi:hypothetical protein
MLASTYQQQSEQSIPFLGLGIFGSGWQIQTWTAGSLLFDLLCAGETSVLANALSSCSTAAAPRFLVDLKGGLSSGVKGALELRDGLGERLRERKEMFEDDLLLDPDAVP